MSRSLKLDTIDKRIMALLAGNGRIRDLELAKAIGVSDDTIRRHRQHLEDEGCFRIEAVFNHRKFGYTSMYQLGIVLTPGVNTRAIAEKLAKLDRVNYVALSLGPTHTILANSRARDGMELNMLVEELRTWREIERVDVNIVYDVVKTMSHRLPEEALELRDG